jgi:hypothetical protein
MDVRNSTGLTDLTKLLNGSNIVPHKSNTITKNAPLFLYKLFFLFFDFPGEILEIIELFLG